MITFKNIGYLGRLGNQMFQFASAVGISKERGLDAGIPVENCTREIGGGPIDTKTGLKMNVKCDLLDCFEIPSKYLFPINEMRTESVYYEGDFRFNPQVLSLNKNTDLYGYFQTERYFEKYRGEILETFTFKGQHILDANSYLLERVYPKSEGKELVSLHVRRGDYVLYPNHHPTCSKDYYSKAMERFDFKNSKFLIFSDDIEWCKGEFHGEQFIFIDSGNPYVDLKLMSMCDHHIIANSSFSWWGAWLNSSEDKKVIAPLNWFGPELNKNTDDIYCKRWEII
jgi:hypothetical protein